MKKLMYWMILQMLIGVWMFVSPYALGFKDLTGAAFNNMLFGVIVVLLGLGVFLYETSQSRTFKRMEPLEKKTS